MKLDETDIESGEDSTILVRERSGGTKLEGAFKKRKGVVLEQSNHAIMFLPAGKKQPTIISIREIGKTEELVNKPCCPREAAKQDWRYANEVATLSEQSDSIDQPIEFETSTTSANENPQKQTTPPERQKKTPTIKELKKKVEIESDSEEDRST